MAWGWYIPLGLLGLLVLVSLLRVRVGCAWEGRFTLWAGLGPLRLTLLPAREKAKKAPSAPRPKKHARHRKSGGAAKPPHRPTLDELLGYARFGLRSAGRTLRCLRVDELTLHAAVGGDDAAQTAIAYGAASAALSSLYPALAARTRIKKHDLSLEAAFGGASRAEFRIQISGMVFCLTVSGLCILFGFLKLRRQHQERR